MAGHTTVANQIPLSKGSRLFLPRNDFFDMGKAVLLMAR